MNTCECLRRIEEKIRDNTPLKELGAFVAHLREIAEAEEQARAQPLNEEMQRVLQFLNTVNDYVHAPEVAKALKIDTPRAEWLLGRLLQSQYISDTPDLPTRYKIRQDGRDAIYGA